jgi:hypothetical protein
MSLSGGRGHAAEKSWTIDLVTWIQLEPPRVLRQLTTPQWVRSRKCDQRGR